MGKQCYFCGKSTIFFIWSTSRIFPRKSQAFEKRDRVMFNAGVPICFPCYYKIMGVHNGDKTEKTSGRKDK